MKKRIVIVMTVASVMALASACGGKTTTAPVESTVVETTPEETTETVAETTKEETTAEETTVATAAEKPDFGDLSDDIYSFQIQVDDEVYQFPMAFTQFTACGWEYDGDENKSLDASYRTSTDVFVKGKQKCYLRIMNFDINARPLKECHIVGITIDHFMVEKGGSRVLAPGGLEIGIAAIEDIKAAHGTPSRENTTSDGSVYITYSKDTYETAKFVVDGKTKTLREYEIQNLTKPADFEAGEVDTEIPAIVGQYQAPAAMSDDFADFIVEYGGTLYQLPAPVSVFEADEWKIVEDQSEMTVAGRDSGWVTMLRDNQKLRVLATNYSEKATAIQNCFITSVITDDYNNKTPLIIAKGITTDISADELESKLSGIDYEKDESGSSYINYQVVPKDSKLDRYDILVKKDTGKVYKIEVRYSPKYSTFVK